MLLGSVKALKGGQGAPMGSTVQSELAGWFFSLGITEE